MTLQQIRLGLMASGLIVASILFNLLIMQPNDGRIARPDRNYRGLSGLPGTPSTTVDEAGSATDWEGAGAGQDSQAAKTASAPASDGGEQGSGLIQSVQRELTRRGYVPGNTTGTLDMVTRAAILAFEHDRGMGLTAEPSIEVLAELKSDVPLAPHSPSTLRKTGPEAEGVIRAVQQSLARLNFRPGPADGVMGQATAGAIRAFERDRQLPETGRVSGLLLMQLAQPAGQGRLAQH
ncbi:MAG TPA: peptidoglycan-binding domain-containing protein [Hyphomicrobiaceae bacterium]|nr:peptidoglycan-binding domain-containing protein [Hyphomicrobiaceae bacterium]